MKKKFDCVEMMHDGAKALRTQIGHLSRGEQLRFWRTQTEALHTTHEQARSAASTDTDSA